ncbi:MAG: hypothetical protein ACKVH6_13730 [Enterobacterales bacterium]
MKHQKSSFIRQYVRASKSPLEDASPILFFADVVDKQTLELGHTHYIYLHRDSVVKTLGISISNPLLEANPEFTARYQDGLEMVVFLLIHIEQMDVCKVDFIETKSLVYFFIMSA